jgi:hypothetical protein
MIDPTFRNPKRLVPPHWVPLLFARENGVELVLVSQGKRQFSLRSGRPTIVLIGDDPVQNAEGPSAFHTNSLERAVQASSGAVIVSSGPEPPMPQQLFQRSTDIMQS